MNTLPIQRSDYLKIRREGIGLNRQILKLLRPSDAQTCGRHLGLLKKKTLVFNNDSEFNIFCEYQIHAYRPNGVSMTELYLRLNRDRLDAFTLALLQRLSTARYSVLSVDSVGKDTLEVTDILRGISFTLMDIGLSQTVRPGNALAGYIASFDDFSIHCGGLLAIDKKLLLADEPMRVLNKFELLRDEGASALPPDLGAKLARAIMSTAIRLGYTEHTIFADPK